MTPLMTPLQYPTIAEYYGTLRKCRCRRVARAYAELADALADQATEIQRTVRWRIQRENPYRTVGELVSCVAATGTLVTLASTPESCPWPWTQRDNDTFRFVHDAIGHWDFGIHPASFGVWGEVTAFHRHLRSLAGRISLAAAGVLANETIGQQAVFYCGPDSGIARDSRPFPDPVACILDPCFWRGL